MWFFFMEDISDSPLAQSHAAKEQRLQGVVASGQFWGPFKGVCADVMGPFKQSDSFWKYEICFLDCF